MFPATYIAPPQSIANILGIDTQAIFFIFRKSIRETRRNVNTLTAGESAHMDVRIGRGEKKKTIPTK